MEQKKSAPVQEELEKPRCVLEMFYIMGVNMFSVNIFLHDTDKTK